MIIMNNKTNVSFARKTALSHLKKHYEQQFFLLCIQTVRD